MVRYLWFPSSAFLQFLESLVSWPLSVPPAELRGSLTTFAHPALRAEGRKTELLLSTIFGKWGQAPSLLSRYADSGLPRRSVKLRKETFTTFKSFRNMS